MPSTSPDNPGSICNDERYMQAMKKQRLKYAREKWQLSPSELDTLAGIEPGTVRTLEAGTRTLDDATAQRLTNALQGRADWG